MAEFPDTRDSLLVRVRSPENRKAWDEFAQLYRPVIYRLARQRGLQDADAQDLAQRVLMAVASAIGRWQKTDETVRFRNWLSRVTRNAIINALSRQPHDRAIGGTGMQQLLHEHPDADPESVSRIELEYRRELYLKAARMVRSDVEHDTWRAFEITVIEQRSIGEAAVELNLSIGSIYAARSRIMRRLREAVQTMEHAET